MIIIKIISLAEQLLKFMVVEYKSTGEDSFSFDLLRNNFQNVNSDFINKALYLLQKDGFVSIFDADNCAYMTALNFEGISNAETDTWYKKGYTIIKEIRSLLP